MGLIVRNGCFFRPTQCVAFKSSRRVMLILLLFFSAIPQLLQAQDTVTTEVSGLVVDEEGESLVGVNVYPKSDMTRGVITDVNGRFAINVPSNEALVFSFIGFASQEIPVNGQRTINVSMVSDATLLDEVVLVGYGSARRANVVGAIASMNVEEIEHYPATNLTNLLEGQMAGVSVSPAQPTGRPGASTRIVIHGTNTFGTAGGAAKDVSPLYVVDGFVVEQEAFDMLDPSDIESFSVLKDASAAVYGARGANGVVLVQTRRGKEGRMRVNYSGSYGISDATQQTEMLSAYDQARMLNERYKNDANYIPFTANDLEQLRSVNHDWLDDAWQSSMISRHSVNISGGSDRVKYYGGGTYVYETGNFDNLDVTKFSYRLGIDAKLTSNLTASVSITIDNKDVMVPYTQSVGTNTMQNLFQPLLQAPKWLPHHIDGLPVYPSEWQEKDNPFAFFESNSYRFNQDKGNTLNTSLKYKFETIPGLEAGLTYSRRENNNYSKQYSIPYNLYEFEPVEGSSYLLSNEVSQVREIRNGNRIMESYDHAKNYQFNANLNYDRTFGLHNLKLFAIYEQSESESFSFDAMAEEQKLYGVETQLAFENERARSRGWMNEGGRQSGIGRFNYSYDNRYFLESTVRLEASTKFSPGERRGIFPSFGAGWVVSEEDFFLNNIFFMDYFKLRSSYGVTGVDYLGAYEYRLQYGISDSYMFGDYPLGGISVNNLGVVSSGVTWEKSRMFNAGLDMKFLGNRLSFAFDAFYKYNFDILTQRSIDMPTTSGITRMVSENLGRLEAWGYDMELGWRENITRDFSWFVKGIFNWNTNRVIEMPTEYGANDFRYPIGRSTYAMGAEQGYIAKGIIRSQEQIDAINAANREAFGYDYTIFSQPLQVGMLYFEDVGRPGNTNEGEARIVHEPDGRVTEDDISFIQSVNEDLHWKNFLPESVTLGAKYKNLSFSAQFTMRYGIANVIVDKLARTAPTMSENAPAFWRDFYTDENPNAEYPSPLFASQNTESSTFWLRDQYQLRLRNVNINYALPNQLVGRWGLSSARVFVSGTNLWTPISTFDYKEDAIARFNTYPLQRTVNFGVNASF